MHWKNSVLRESRNRNNSSGLPHHENEAYRRIQAAKSILEKKKKEKKRLGPIMLCSNNGQRSLIRQRDHQ
jgi:hypothetical protein